MNSFLNSPLFYYFVLPLGSTVLIVMAKFFSKKDNVLHKFKKEDAAIGIDLSVAALILFTTETAKEFSNLKNLDSVPMHIFENNWLILLFALGLFILTNIIRMYGWKKGNRVNMGEEMNLWLGVIIPNCYGILTLTVTFNRIGG